MARVDFEFRPSVPVFDANVALGRHHIRRVRIDDVEGTLAAMNKAGVDRAIVHSPHATNFDPQDGNSLLLEMIKGQPRLIPQFVCNPVHDDLGIFADEVSQRGIRSIRMVPKSSRYPFREWVVKPWLDWCSAERIPLWLPAPEVEPPDLYDTLKQSSQTNVVLCEVHYSHVPWVLPLVRSLPNAYVEISRFVISDGIQRLLDVIGDRRILYGSWFPDSPMGPQLYMLHHSNLDHEVLSNVCGTNLERLLWSQ